jgi:hypothetical protein
MRVGRLDVSILTDAEGSFATIEQAVPALSSSKEWRLPVNAVLIYGEGFSWSSLAEDGETAVE